MMKEEIPAIPSWEAALLNMIPVHLHQAVWYLGRQRSNPLLVPHGRERLKTEQGDILERRPNGSLGAP